MLIPLFSHSRFERAYATQHLPKPRSPDLFRLCSRLRLITTSATTFPPTSSFQQPSSCNLHTSIPPNHRTYIARSLEQSSIETIRPTPILFATVSRNPSSKNKFPTCPTLPTIPTSPPAVLVARGHSKVLEMLEHKRFKRLVDDCFLRGDRGLFDRRPKLVREEFGARIRRRTGCRQLAPSNPLPHKHRFSPTTLEVRVSRQVCFQTCRSYVDVEPEIRQSIWIDQSEARPIFGTRNSLPRVAE